MGHLFIYILRPFLKVEVQNWNIFFFFFFGGGGVAKFQIFFGGMPDIFVVKSRYWVQATYQEKIDYPTLGQHHKVWKGISASCARMHDLCIVWLIPVQTKGWIQKVLSVGVQLCQHFFQGIRTRFAKKPSYEGLDGV